LTPSLSVSSLATGERAALGGFVRREVMKIGSCTSFIFVYDLKITGRFVKRVKTDIITLDTSQWGLFFNNNFREKFGKKKHATTNEPSHV
jgi:hypothetical protein